MMPNEIATLPMSAEPGFERGARAGADCKAVGAETDGSDNGFQNIHTLLSQVYNFASQI